MKVFEEAPRTMNDSKTNHKHMNSSRFLHKTVSASIIISLFIRTKI